MGGGYLVVGICTVTNYKFLRVCQYHWGRNSYIPVLLFWGIIYGNLYWKLYSMIFLGDLDTVM